MIICVESRVPHFGTFFTGTMYNTCDTINRAPVVTLHLGESCGHDADVDVREQPRVEEPCEPVQCRRLHKNISQACNHV